MAVWNSFILIGHFLWSSICGAPIIDRALGFVTVKVLGGEINAKPTDAWPTVCDGLRLHCMQLHLYKKSK